ncbi:MAG: M13 family metallopeptidase [Saprospiraceae bacterium]|nr:M13 family metallopeptidase [Saprospiraceae bacterium]
MNRYVLPAVLAAVLCSYCAPAPAPAKPDLLSANIDSSRSPGDDFFLWAEGRWINNNPIPEIESAWGIGYLVNEELYLRKRNINEQAVQDNAPAGSITRKIADFWLSAMDTLALEKEGLAPLDADLKRIGALKTADELLALASDFSARGIDLLLSGSVSQDAKNSERYAFYLMQGGLGMPNREYYFDADEKTVQVRAAYQTYLSGTFAQLGYPPAEVARYTEAVYALEKRLAQASRKLADLRDPYLNYNKMSLEEWSRKTPRINWPLYLQPQGIARLDTVIVGQPEFYTALNRELGSTPMDVWQAYLKFHLLRSSAEYLDAATFGRSFAYNQSISGAKQPRPRWKRVLDSEEEALGEALGQLFAKEFFNEKAKKRYSDMVENVRAAYKERIARLPWMSDSTKQRAYEKLARITKKVGYPDTWKDFSQMDIRRQAYVLNMQNANRWWTQYHNSKLGKPVDRSEWSMTPQTYNAYYDPSNNEIVLPAGIFAVPGYKDEELDDAFVYGYAGASTIGHEITHGFDDQGRQFDALGNLKNWWTPADEAEFKTRAQVIIRQFNAFMPVDTLHVNGEASQGENIADLGGVLIGLDAFKKTEAYKSGKPIAGLTPVQRYFLGYAYGWLYHERKESLAAQLKTDVHAPAKERVNGPFVNVKEFYEAFHITPADKMHRPDSLRVSIW